MDRSGHLVRSYGERTHYETVARVDSGRVQTAVASITRIGPAVLVVLAIRRNKSDSYQTVLAAARSLLADLECLESVDP